MTRLSIALCTYNGERYLPEQLASFASQTRPPDELVVCDDGSSDGTLQLVKEFARSSPFPVRLFRNERNLRSTKNFEQAIGRCSGEIIFLADQDDVWHPEKLGVIEKVFDESPGSGAAFSNAELTDPDLKPLGYSLWDSIRFTRFQRHCFSQGRSLDVLLKHNVAAGATFAFRKEFRELVLPIPDIWTHDAWISLLIAAVSGIRMIGRPLIRYRQHGSNQIGAVRQDFEKQVSMAKNKRRAYYDGIYHQFLQARERLLRSKLPLREAALSKIDARARHLAKRANFAPERWRRFPGVIAEFLALHYYRYSNGVKSFAKDLLLD